VGIITAGQPFYLAVVILTEAQESKMAGKKKRGGDDEDDRALVTMFYFFPEEFQVFIRHPDTVSKFQSWYVKLC